MSIRLRSRVRVDFQLWSSFLKPQVSFIVMQVSQSRPGMPVAGMLLLGRVEVLGQLDAVVDDDRRLERADHGDHLRGTVLLGGVLPAAVKPDHADRAVVGQQLSELALHVVDVAVVVGPCGGPSVPRRGLPAPARQVVGMVPVEDRMVPAHLEPLFAACVGQLLHDVPLEGRAHDVPVGQFGIEQAEALVVLRGDHDVLHARGFGDAGPLAGVELHRVELLLERLILCRGDLAAELDPLAGAGTLLPFHSPAGTA